VVIICGALASTIELGPRDMNDFIFLQRMYDAGAKDYFDIMAMQGYGLWSGPYDRRMNPEGYKLLQGAFRKGHNGEERRCQ